MFLNFITLILFLKLIQFKSAVKKYIPVKI